MIKVRFPDTSQRNNVYAPYEAKTYLLYLL